MPTKAQEFIEAARKHKDARDEFTLRVNSVLLLMEHELQELLGTPARVQRLNLTSVQGQEYEEVDLAEGTLLTRKGAYFALNIQIHNWSAHLHSSIFPVGDQVFARISSDDRQAMNVSSQEGVQEWCKWVTDTWLPEQFEETINGSIAKRVAKKP